MRYRYQSGETTYEVTLERHGEGYRATVNGQPYELEVLDAQPGGFSLRLAAASDDPAAPFRPEIVYWAAQGGVKWLSSHGCTYRLEQPTGRRERGSAAGAAADSVRAPMPSQVRAVQVAEGDIVEAGQGLLLLEAMKMEIRLPAPRRGRVARLLAKPGDTVARDQVLVELEQIGE